MKNINQCINYDKQEAYIQNKHGSLKFNITKFSTHNSVYFYYLTVILYNILLY